MLGNFSGGFGGPHVFSPSSTKPKYRVLKMGEGGKINPLLIHVKEKNKLYNYVAVLSIQNAHLDWLASLYIGYRDWHLVMTQ